MMISMSSFGWMLHKLLGSVADLFDEAMMTMRSMSAEINVTGQSERQYG